MAETTQVGFLLIPGFALMSYAAAVEPLRQANRLAGGPLYAWRHISIDGAPVAASCGVTILPEHRVGDPIPLDLLVVVASLGAETFADSRTFAWVRSLARRGHTRIAGLSAGTYVLARAGVLNGYRATLHWEDMPGFIEAFPKLEITRGLYEIDRDRLTCPGGTATLDLMHALIRAQHGPVLARAVADQFLQTQIREGAAPQRMAVRERLGVSHPGLLAALELMEQRSEEPASRSALADTARVSVRQLERLFRRHLGTTVENHYRGVRLDRARALLRQTEMSVLAVAMACGFVNVSHFSRCYRQRFGHPPSTGRTR